MSMASDAGKPRILVIDDSPAIHGDFRKIFRSGSELENALSASEAVLFSESLAGGGGPELDIDFALQGEQGFAMVSEAVAQGRPYAMAFIDMRMPPGWDGLQTAVRIWECDPEIQIVICTAYSDYSLNQILAKLGRSDRLLILKKPFDNIEVLQLADALVRKWTLNREARRKVAELEQTVDAHARDLKHSKDRLEQLLRQLAAAGLQEKILMNTQSRNRLIMEENLRSALSNGELSVHYQPLVDVATRRVVSLEALVRWRHPEQGMISPGDFIPLAEETGLIVPLGEFVLRTVCQQVVAWDRQQVPVVPVAVNISVVQLQRQNLYEFFSRILNETGMSPHLAVLELTETTLITNARSHIAELQALRDMGVGIEVDDFGTGYSSLSYLRHLPIDTLKIDRSFIHQIHVNPADEAIVNAILAMAHCLGLNVTAEGVETEAQLEVLRRLGCEVAQGFYFSRPLPAEQCREFLCELAQRPTFTETLRLEVTRGGQRFLLARQR